LRQSHQHPKQQKHQRDYGQQNNRHNVLSHAKDYMESTCDD
jgi:hypothetical protein